MMIDWNQVVLNIRSKGYKNEHIQTHTGISRHKIQNIVLERNFKLDWYESLRLLDFHYDRVPERHDRRLFLNG